MKKTVAFRCPGDLLAEIDERATREGRRTSEIVVRLLRDAISEDPAEALMSRLQGLEDSIGDLHLDQSELAVALSQIGLQVRAGFEAVMLNLAPDNSREEIAAWINDRFPPLRIGGRE